MSAIETRMHEAEARWSQLHFKRKTPNEASASCPFCFQGKDRFLIFDDGGYWCRQCDAKGWLDENESEYGKMSPEERRLLLIEAEQRRARNEREEQERRLSALEQMHRCTDHLRYHHEMPLDKMEYWLDEGITVDSIAKYQLGYCPRCPCDREGRPSYTIPVFDRDGKTLINIRHRLIGADNGDKYRPHVAGLGTQLFNSSVLNKPVERVVILEGEKKSVIFNQVGFPAVATMGKSIFSKSWLDWFKNAHEVVIALDPGATESAWRLGGILRGVNRNVRIAQFPVKPDDAIVRYGATSDVIEFFLRLARPVRNERN